MLRRSATIALFLALALPGSALAHDTYVDRTDGNNLGNTNHCHSKALPCSTLGRGISEAGNGDTVFVGGDPDPFTVPEDLGDGKSIVHKDFSKSSSIDTSGKTVIDTGSASAAAIRVVDDAGQIKGLTIRSEDEALDILARVTVTHDRFDESAQVDRDVVVSGSAAKATVTHNTFVDPTPSTAPADGEYGLYVDGAAAVVAHNRFKDFWTGVDALGDGRAKVTHNNISGTHGVGSTSGSGITTSSKPLIADNHLHDSDGTVFDDAILVNGPAAHPDIDRNLISDYNDGVLVTAGRAALADDVIVGFAGMGISISSSALTVSASGLTIAGPGLGADVESGTLKLDSTLVDADPIFTAASGTCSIKFSRGPVTGSGNAGCDDFQTTKNPKLKSDGYHLKPSSPLIDKGNPNKPKHGEKDIDGDKRALKCGGGKARRDIGADEVKC